MRRACYLGLEGGGTRTRVLVADAAGRICRHAEFGPLNLQLVSDRQICSVLRRFRPTHAAVCIAGCGTAADRRRLCRCVRRVWPQTKLFVGSDLDSGLAAAFGVSGPGILILSGTGSVVVGRNAQGAVARAGGWGHLLGDHGSGYWIALSGLRAAIRSFDRQGRCPTTLRRVLRRLRLDRPDQLVDWIHHAGKEEIAALADVFQRDVALLTEAASALALDAKAVARKLQFSPTRIALAGGTLRHQPLLRRLLTARLQKLFPAATVTVLRRDTVYGALLLARAAAADAPAPLRPNRPA